MRIGITLCAAALLLAGCAGRPFTATKYGQMGLLGGYKEEVIGPGMWEVLARSNGPAGRGYGRNMAVYRAAELARAAGYSHIQILDQEGKSRMVGYGAPTNFAGEHLKIVVRGAHSPAPPPDCRAKLASACFTLPVDQVITRLGPSLYIAPPAAAIGF